MSDTQCGYNCSEHPAVLSQYADISGSGVVVGYVANAGIAVAILFLHYIVAYNLEEYPFRKGDGSTPQSPARPNPVDSVIFNLLPKKEIQRRKIRNNHDLQRVCVKCIKCMSDLQTLTGMSILASGYAQLRCGLSCYHWQILAYLAWFSTLTNLSCLTFLRNHLYNNPAERASRLIAIVIQLGMLVVALVPTSNYHWTMQRKIWEQPTPSPMDYAICYFNPSSPAYMVVFPTGERRVEGAAYTAMVVSVLSLCLGFCTRVVKLHRCLSVTLLGRSRQSVSDLLRNRLISVYGFLEIKNEPKSLQKTLIYRPLLAAFLALRIIVDTWTSMFMEIFWLLASFAWGISKLLTTLALNDHIGENYWTFGQIVPVILLAAPLSSIFEYFYPVIIYRCFRGDRDSMRSVSSACRSPELPSETIKRATLLNEPVTSADHPNFDYYKSDWTSNLVCFLLLDCFVVSASCIFCVVTEQSWVEYLLPTTHSIWEWLPLIQLVGLYLFIVFSLLLDDLQLRGDESCQKKQRIVLRFIIGSYYLFAVNYPYVIEYFISPPVGLYIVSCIVHRFVRETGAEIHV